MAEHVRFHMTSVPVSRIPGNCHCSVTGRKGAREKEGREMERERAEKALIREGGFGRDSQAPPPVSAAANQRPAGLEGAGPRGRGRGSRREAGAADLGARRRPELKPVLRDCPNRAAEGGAARRGGQACR